MWKPIDTCTKATNRKYLWNGDHKSILKSGHFPYHPLYLTLLTLLLQISNGNLPRLSQIQIRLQQIFLSVRIPINNCTMLMELFVKITTKVIPSKLSQREITISKSEYLVPLNCRSSFILEGISFTFLYIFFRWHYIRCKIPVVPLDCEQLKYYARRK